MKQMRNDVRRIAIYTHGRMYHEIPDSSECDPLGPLLHLWVTPGLAFL
jgi:hypothetical protein